MIVEDDYRSRASPSYALTPWPRGLTHSVMTITGLIVLLCIAGACGGLGSALAGYSHLGCISSIALGFVGAWLGAWFAHQLHLPELFILHVQNESFPVVWSIIGAAVAAAVISLLARRNRYG